MVYAYSFHENKFWISLKNKDLKQTPSSIVSQHKPELSYYTSSGQFISSCFFFIEGIDSATTQSKLEKIFLEKNDVKNISDVQLLENEDFVASYIFKYIIQNNQCVLDVLLTSLSYLRDTSLYLAKKTNPKFHFQSVDTAVFTGITRCSYKFCQHAHFCEYNYPEKKSKHKFGCYSDHYVHHKLTQDLSHLVRYIETTFKDKSLVPIRKNQEIIKCVNTISFVIKHMYDELWNVYLSNGDNYMKFHRNIANHP